MAYLVQIDDLVREATADEIKQIELNIQLAAEREKQKAEREAAKLSAKTKLAALGLTENEITALVGI